MKKTALLPLSAAIVFSVTAYAGETKEVYQQDSILVTASRFEQAEVDIIPSVTVIDREDILNLQANSILDLLAMQQGLDVARSGGIGSQTSVFMRGTNSNHTLILINGMRVSSSFTGSFTWEHLPVSQIQRIEIVRGTRVSYYGSDAIGGVINIITRNQDKLYARFTTGSFATNNVDIGFGNNSEKGQYSLVFGSQKTDGFSATNENNAFAFNPDDDGYNNLSLNANGSIALSNGKLSLNYLETKADFDFDSFFDVGNSDSTERVVRITWQNKIFNDWNSEIAIGNNKNSLTTKVFSNSYDSQRHSLDWLLNKDFKTNHLGLGITYRKEESSFHNSIVNTLNYTDSRNNFAGFANLRSVVNKNIFSISGRYDNNSVYGNDVSADLDWAYQFNKNIRLNLSAGSAFHAPTLNDLFSPSFQSIVYSPELNQFVNFFAFEGNPDLKPEESLNYEMGLKTNISANQNLSLNVFYYKIDNLIDYQGSTFMPVNVNQATIKGLEAAYNYQVNNLILNINATLQDANNDENDTALLRRPDNKFNLSVDKHYGDFSIGTSVRYASKNPDFGIVLDGFTTIDLRAAYKLNKNWKISAKIENAADVSYQIINGYNTPKASGYLSIQWQQ